MKFMLLTQCPRVFVRMSSDFLIPPGKKSTIFFCKKNIVFGLCTCSQLKYYVWTEKKTCTRFVIVTPNFLLCHVCKPFATGAVELQYIAFKITVCPLMIHYSCTIFGCDYYSSASPRDYRNSRGNFTRNLDYGRLVGRRTTRKGTVEL